MTRWANTAGGDKWVVEIEHDRFSDGQPFVVSIWIEGEEAGATEAFEALVTPTPEQAREMAAALKLYADLAERANARKGFAA